MEEKTLSYNDDKVINKLKRRGQESIKNGIRTIGRIGMQAVDLM